MQPEEGGEEGLGAIGTRTIHLGLFTPALWDLFGRRPHEHGARLHEVGQRQRHKDRQGGMLRPIESRKSVSQSVNQLSLIHI